MVPMKTKRQELHELILEGIAREYLRVPTLETRNSKVLDLHDVAVWRVRAALEAAYLAGFRAAREDRT